MNARARSITYLAVPGIPLVQPGDDLVKLVVAALTAEGVRLVHGDVVVMAQKSSPRRKTAMSA